MQRDLSPPPTHVRIHKALEGSPRWTSPGSHHKGYWWGTLFHSLGPAPWMVGLSLMQPVEWRERGMLFGAATRSQFLTAVGLLDAFPKADCSLIF